MPHYWSCCRLGQYHTVAMSTCEPALMLSIPRGGAGYCDCPENPRAKPAAANEWRPAVNPRCRQLNQAAKYPYTLPGETGKTAYLIVDVLVHYCTALFIAKIVYFVQNASKHVRWSIGRYMICLHVTRSPQCSSCGEFFGKVFWCQN